MTEELRWIGEDLMTLTELQERLSGTPTKHVLAVWDGGRRKGDG